MKQLNEVLFIVHAGFNESIREKMEENIKSKIDDLALGIKNGVENILIFVDECGVVPGNINRREDLYDYAVLNLGYNKVFQAYMSKIDFKLYYNIGKELNVISHYFIKNKIECNFKESEKIINKSGYFFSNNTKMSLGGEYYELCVEGYKRLYKNFFGRDLEKSLDISLSNWDLV